MFSFQREAELHALVDAYEEATPSHQVSLQEDRYAGLIPCPPEPKKNACAKCGAQKIKHGTNPYCPSCQDAYKKDYYAKKKQAALEQDEQTRLWYEYRHDCWLRAHYPGVDRAVYVKQLQAQSNVCAICTCEETRLDARTGRPLSYHVDYDPKVRDIRMLVCQACAKVLAFIHVDKARALRLANYIQTWNEDVQETCAMEI